MRRYRKLLEVLNVAPVRNLAGKTIDAEAVIGGVLLPGTVSSRIEKAYRDVLFGTATLQDLPADSEGPRFVINATNVQTGVLFRFSRPFMADYLVGMINAPTVSLAKAVAASSAFPPVLSPCTLEVDPSEFVSDPKCPLQEKPFTSDIVLSDGGVYDNMGIETAWKSFQTVLVSDAGGKLQPEAEPKTDWARHAYRIMEIIDNQVRSLRKRQIIEAYKNPNDDHDGTYWGIRSQVADYQLADSIQCDPTRTLELAQTPTRLKRLDPEYQERLINWGYAICDTAIRAHIDPTLKKGTLPFPASMI
jgi:NTE family protein